MAGGPFGERGDITDESIAIMKELWTQEDPSYQGRFHSFSGMKFSPKPAQKPHIPLLIGGTSRAARAGNGWHPTALDPETLRVLGEGREPAEIPVSVSAAIGEAPQGRYSLGEDPAEILQKAQVYESLGVDQLVISPNTRDGAKMLPALEMLAERVLPAFR